MQYKKNKPKLLWMHHAREIKVTCITFFRSIFYKNNSENQIDVEKLVAVQTSSPSIESDDNQLTDHITIASWNIFKGYYQEIVNASLQNIADKYHPDVWLLQEATIDDSKFKLPEFGNTEGHTQYISSHKFNESHQFYPYSHSGQLTHSRFAFSESEVAVLPQVTNYESWAESTEFLHRVFLYTKLAAADKKTIGIYNVHLENMTMPSGRSFQIDHVLKMIEQKNDDFVVIGGDFNTFFTKRFEGVFKKLSSQGFVNLKQPELRLLPRLDFIFAKGFASGEVIPLKAGGSDHNPIVAKFYLK